VTFAEKADELAEKPHLHMSTLRRLHLSSLRPRWGPDLSATAVPPQALGALCFKTKSIEGRIRAKGTDAWRPFSGRARVA